MEHEFWQTRWRENRIGFHRSEVHPTLVEFAPGLSAWPGRVFVPLSGKTLDLLWLAQQGCSVLANELVPQAVEQFFGENALAFDVSEAGRFRRYMARDYDITVLQGDVFAVGDRELEGVQWVYDRASIVALPPAMRARFGILLQERLPLSAELLITTFEYDQSKMSGPPFSVTPNEIKLLFSEFSLEEIRSRSLPELASLQAQRPDEIREHVLIGRRRHRNGDR